MSRFYINYSTEPDMREELENTFDGVFPEIAKKQPALLRKMRRDSNNKLIPCDCVDPVTKEPDKDTFCPICHGEAYIWDETYVDCYSVEIRSDVGQAGEKVFSPGILDISYKIFYMRYSVDITEEDKVVELVLDKEGEIAQPPRRKVLYRIGSALDLRSDHGKLEYWKLDCFSEFRKFLNGV